MAIKTFFFDTFFLRTRLAYTWTRILDTPFWAIYSLLPFILVKDLGASAWHIAAIVCLKPMISLVSLYWSSPVRKRRDRLIPNIIWASVLGHVPFLFFPWVSNPWYFVFASTVYMLFHRGGNPAWMEVLKINIPEIARKSVFACGAALYHLGGALLAILIGYILDDTMQAWRWLFPLTAILALLSIIFQAVTPVKKEEQEQLPVVHLNMKEQLVQPWKEAYELIKQRPDFAKFQIGFMLAGGGLMFWQPALPQFFMETLQLNYKELTFAMTLCKSFGYAAALPVWTRGMNKINIFTFTGLVTASASLFPLCLMAAEASLVWLYAAYVLYGMMQAGSELSWNLSGPIFSKNEDSSTYTGVNVLTIGLRGCVAPPLGSFICNIVNAASVLWIGGGLCLLATWQMLRSRKQERESLADQNELQAEFD